MAWNDETAVGKTPAEAFGPIAGECSAPLNWDATAVGDRAVTPRQATSEMRVRVELDEGSAVLVLPPAGAQPDVCPARLEVQANVHLEADDGTFAEMGRTTVAYVGAAKGELWGPEGLRPMALLRDVEDLGGALSVELGDAEAASLTFDFEGPAENCAGSISLTISEVHGNMGSSGSGQVGSWSKNGCGLGGERVALDEPSAGGTSLLDQIDALWGDLTLAGTWDDGQPTTLRISTDVDVVTACRDAYGEAHIPARVTYGTDDGRITPHEIETIVYAGASEFSLHLNLSDEMVCESKVETLLQSFHTCEDVQSVTVQLSMYEKPDGGLEVSDDGLNVYATGRSDDQDIRVRNLSFEL